VVDLPSRYKDRIYDVLSGEPITPNEVAKKLGVNFKTAKDALMRLAVTRKTCTTSRRAGYTYSGGRRFE
jgi:Mn-dependent DtxR family transcriptional regulator